MEYAARKNLELMRQGREGNMESLLAIESLGGNAGHMPDGRPCAGANFYFDRNTGEIKYFCNIQDAPENITPQYARGMFRVAVDFGRTWKQEIVDAFYHGPDALSGLEKISDTPNISEVARQVLQMCVVLYNSEPNPK